MPLPLLLLLLLLLLLPLPFEAGSEGGGVISVEASSCDGERSRRLEAAAADGPCVLSSPRCASSASEQE